MGNRESKPAYNEKKLQRQNHKKEEKTTTSSQVASKEGEKICSSYDSSLIFCQEVRPETNVSDQQSLCTSQMSEGNTRPTSEQMVLSDHVIQSQTKSEEALQEKITLETMLMKHIIEGKAHASLCTCTAIISDVEKCGKTQALKYFLSHAVQTKDEKTLSPLLKHSQSAEDRECMSCYKVVILGSQPFEKLTWMISPTEDDDVVICLLSYFAKLCKTRNRYFQGDYYRLLEFAPLLATSEGINISAEVGDQMKLLYSKLMKQWEWLKDDENFQAVVPTGVGLLNIFDIGDCKAAQDFRPILNKYCKRSVNIACYSSTECAAVLKALTEENDQHYYKSMKCKLLKQLSGCIHKEQIVTLAAINTGFAKQESKQEVELTEAVERNLGIENVHHLQIHHELMENAKSELEKSVLGASFYNDIPLQFLLLLHKLRTEHKLFWTKRSDIESLSKLYKFENGDLERFLRLFSSFGSIFYTHDIPSLREYVIIDIVRFVKYIHDLYNVKEDAAKYGLFKYRGEEDWKVIFEFLTTLGIAVEVKSNQIVPHQNLSLNAVTPYYYIPSARSTSISSSHSISIADLPQRFSISSDTGSISNGYTTENLQALLCKQLLLSTNCLLCPTKSINTTVIRFCEASLKEQDVQFIDVGNKVVMSILNTGSDEYEKKEDIYSRIASKCSVLTTHPLHCTSSGTSERPNTNLSEAHENAKQRLTDIPHEKMFAAAQKFSECSLANLASRFRLDQEWVQQLEEVMIKREVIVHMLYKYKENVTLENFTKELQELDIHFT